MGTIYSAFGVKAVGESRLDIQDDADKKLDVNKKILGWSYTDVLQHQFVESEGHLADYLGRSFLFEPSLGWLAHAKKYAPSEEIWAELCIIFPHMGKKACLLESSGTVLLVRIDDSVWLSDDETNAEDAEGWINFAQKNLPFETMTVISQDKIQDKMRERNL